jgi:hypothetical protein
MATFEVMAPCSKSGCHHCFKRIGCTHVHCRAPTVHPVCVPYSRYKNIFCFRMYLHLLVLRWIGSPPTKYLATHRRCNIRETSWTKRTKNGKDKQKQQCVDCKKSLTLRKQIYYSKKRRKLQGALIKRILKIQIFWGHNAASNSTHLPMFRKCLLPSSAEIRVYSETEHEARSSRRSATIYQVTPTHIPENSNLRQHRWENLQFEPASKSISCSNHSRFWSTYIFRTNNKKY